MLRGIIAVFKEARSICAGLETECATIRRQIDRFGRELAYCQLRSALTNRDRASVSESLRTLSGCSVGPVVQLVTRLTEKWPAPLMWAYQARQALRSTGRT
jgi:hypothetical protein